MSNTTLQQLGHLGLIRIDGEDATSFLQGQLSNDVTLADQQWQFSGYCSPKGRLLALLQLWQFDGVYYAILDKSLCEATLKRLRMYVMRSKVVITELNEFAFYAAQEWGTVDAALPNMRPPENNAVVMGSSKGDSAIVIHYGEQFLVMSPDRAMAEKANSNASKWHESNILAGLPRITSNTLELFIPQMLNLDVIGGINFKKGCYTGQEIIARMHYLGKLKQRMFVASIKGKSPEPGAEVYADTACEKSIGSIVDASKENALAVLRLSALEDTTEFYLNEETSLKVNTTQPYELPSPKNK